MWSPGLQVRLVSSIVLQADLQEIHRQPAHFRQGLQTLSCQRGSRLQLATLLQG